MSRNRSEWPEPWIRLRWSENDLKRIGKLLKFVEDGRELADRDFRFVKEMALSVDATLQQVAWLRKLAKRYQMDPPSDGADRRIDLED